MFVQGLLAAGLLVSGLRICDVGVSTLIVPRCSIICSCVSEIASWF